MNKKTRKERREEAYQHLLSTGFFYDIDEDYPRLTVNINDIFCPGADSEEVPRKHFIFVSRLIQDYGFGGLLWYVAQKRGSKYPYGKFRHYNRMIEFVRNEENIRNKYYNEKYYYRKYSYTLGEEIENISGDKNETMFSRFLGWFSK